MKNTIALTLIVVFLFVTVIPVSAAESGEFCESEGIMVASEFNESSLDVEVIDTQGTTLPSQFYDLNKGSYYAQLSFVGEPWLYTNKCFYPDGNGVIKAVVLVTTKKVRNSVFSSYEHYDALFCVGIYDLTAGKRGAEQQEKVKAKTWYSGNIVFDGLNPSHKYAVCFRCFPVRALRTAITGCAFIQH